MSTFDPFNGDGVWAVNEHVMMDPNNLDNAIRYVQQHHCPQIGIYDFHRAQHRIDLSFLQDMPYVRSVQLDCGLPSGANLEPLYSMPKLARLGVGGRVPGLDLGCCSALTTVFFLYQENMNFNSATIEHVHVVGAPHVNFMTHIPQALSLHIKHYRGRELNGLGEASRLREFTASSATRLVNVEDLKLCSNLRSVELGNVPRRLNYDALGQCPNVAALYLRSVIPTCRFVGTMPKLWSFVCKEIADDDLTPLMKSHSLTFVHLYRHKHSYNYSRKDVEARFGTHKFSGSNVIDHTFLPQRI